MHVAIEKARKAAGIGSLKKNYPQNPRERGCGFWAGFVCVLSDQLASMDAEALSDKQRISELAVNNATLERKLSEMRTGRIANGVEALGLAEGWLPEKRDSVLSRIAG